MLKIQNLTKKFSSFTAVDNISIDVKPGEFYGFLGPNGAGKTTTIKMIVGLYTPTIGQIYVNGIDNLKQPVEAKKIIGYIPDQPYLYEKLTGREFLYFSGGLYNLNGGILKEKIEKVIDELKIGSWIDKRTEEYSQGMKQRITIASALIHNPKLIVIDEPMVGLDPQTAVIVKKILKKKSEEGNAVFMSTHSLNVAEELCNKVGIIKEGKIIFESGMEELQKFKIEQQKNFESFFIELTQ